MKPTSLSLAICTHNHAVALQKTLASLRTLRSPAQDWELLIIDNASSDETRGMLQHDKWHLPAITCRVAREARLGVANARNRALHEARGDYVVFLDDDETPDRDWLVEMARVTTTRQPDAAGGRIEVGFEDCNRPRWLTDELLGFLGRLDYGSSEILLTQSSTPIFTGNAAFHRRRALDMGGFDVSLGRRGAIQSGGEDTDFYRRLAAAGGKIVWVPSAVIFHRIEARKLKRSYFLDLHFRQGRSEGSRKRGAASRLPPKYLWPQVARAFSRAAVQRLGRGADCSLRLEMNAAYFAGYLLGWIRDPA